MVAMCFSLVCDTFMTALSLAARLYTERVPAIIDDRFVYKVNEEFQPQKSTFALIKWKIFTHNLANKTEPQLTTVQ